MSCNNIYDDKNDSDEIIMITIQISFMIIKAMIIIIIIIMMMIIITNNDT